MDEVITIIINYSYYSGWMRAQVKSLRQENQYPETAAWMQVIAGWSFWYDIVFPQAGSAAIRTAMMNYDVAFLQESPSSYSKQVFKTTIRFKIRF